MTIETLRRVRWVVRAVLTLGVAASVAANVLHALPNVVSQTIAAWPPLALLLTVELIARVPVHSRGLAALRLAATAAIAGIAAWVSYWHMVGVAARYGETGLSPYLLPLSVDGLIVVASICLVEIAGRIRDMGALAPDAEPPSGGTDTDEPAPDPWAYADPLPPPDSPKDDVRVQGPPSPAPPRTPRRTRTPRPPRTPKPADDKPRTRTGPPSDADMAAAYDRCAKRDGYPPASRVLAAEAGCGHVYANNWINRHRPRTNGSDDLGPPVGAVAVSQ